MVIELISMLDVQLNNQIDVLMVLVEQDKSIVQYLQDVHYLKKPYRCNSGRCAENATVCLGLDKNLKNCSNNMTRSADGYCRLNTTK